MSRSMILRALVFIALFSVSMPAWAADPIFPTGSRLGFVPPPGFVASSRFPGFENTDTTSTVILLALPPQAYAEVEKSLAADAIKGQGITEEKRETLTLPNGTGVLVIGTEEENGQKFRKWMFLGALPEGTALAAVRVPETARQTYSDDTIRTALLTLTTRPSVPLQEQLTLLPFKIGELSGLRPVRVVGGNGVFMTEGPSDTPDVAQQPVFVVSVGQGGPESVDERTKFARNLFTGLADFKDVRIVSGDMLRLGGNGNQPTHELQAEAKDGKTDVAMKMVQWVRFGSGGFVRMVGVARADQWAAAFPRFRAVRDGIGPRE
jgi:hypothetical protein